MNASGAFALQGPLCENVATSLCDEGVMMIHTDSFQRSFSPCINFTYISLLYIIFLRISHFDFSGSHTLLIS